MTSIARCRLLLTVVAATVLLATPASASVTTAGAAGCRPTPVAQPFAPWSDTADYFLAPDGGLEQGGAGWTLRGRASVLSGNEPFAVGEASDHSSLGLAAGATATTASFCIGVEHRSMRFFANAARASTLDVDVLYPDAGGVERSLRIATVIGAAAWSPTDVVPMVVNKLAADRGNAMSVRLRFTPRDKGAWTIDDVYIDPFRGK